MLLDSLIWETASTRTHKPNIVNESLDGGIVNTTEVNEVLLILKKQKKKDYQQCYIGPVKQKKNLSKIAIIFLSINLNMCFGCSKEPSHRVPTTYVLIEK